MRALRLWTDIAEWRWTPAVGLSIAATTFVVLAVVVIPDHIGNDSADAQRSRFESLRARGTSFTASIAPAVTEPEQPAAPAPSPHVQLAQHVARGPATAPDQFPRRGFSPPLPRPEVEAPPPAPPPPPAVVIPPPQPQPQAPPPAPEAPPPAPAPPPAAPPAAEAPQAAPPAAAEAAPVPAPPQ